MKTRNLAQKHGFERNKAQVMRDRKKDVKKGVRKHKKPLDRGSFVCDSANAR